MYPRKSCFKQVIAVLYALKLLLLFNSNSLFAQYLEVETHFEQWSKPSSVLLILPVITSLYVDLNSIKNEKPKGKIYLVNYGDNEQHHQQPKASYKESTVCDQNQNNSRYTEATVGAKPKASSCSSAGDGGDDGDDQKRDADALKEDKDLLLGALELLPSNSASDASDFPDILSNELTWTSDTSIKIEIQGKTVSALVDTGAQMSLISLELSESLGLNRILDERWAGIAKGGGTSRIQGRIFNVMFHTNSMDNQKVTFILPLSVLESNNIPFLLGLDFLKRHNGIMNYKDRTVTLFESGTEFVLPFLSYSATSPSLFTTDQCEQAQNNLNNTETTLISTVYEADESDDDIELTTCCYQKNETDELMPKQAVFFQDDDHSKSEEDSCNRVSNVEFIMSMGLNKTQEEVEEALQNTNNDPEEALLLLLSTDQ